MNRRNTSALLFPQKVLFRSDFQNNYIFARRLETHVFLLINIKKPASGAGLNEFNLRVMFQKDK